MAQQPVPISGIHLARIGDYVIVKAEIDGEWVEVIRHADAVVDRTNYAVPQ